MKFKGRFVQFPLSLLRGDTNLDEHAKIVWLVLATYADKEGLCWPCIKTIGADAGICEWTARRAVKTLEKHGWIKGIVRKGTSSLYRLIVPCAVSKQLSSTSAVSHTGLSRQRSINTESTEVVQCHTPEGPVSHTDELDSLPISKEILKRVELKKHQPDELLPSQKSNQGQGQEEEQADFACSYVDGHFRLGSVARAQLEEAHTNVDLDEIMAQAEARLGKGKPHPIPNALAYLDTCCSHPGGDSPDGWADRLAVADDVKKSEAVLYVKPDDERRAKLELEQEKLAEKIRARAKSWEEQ